VTFELKADGVRILCSSPVWTRKLVEKGARLVDANQAEQLLRALESAEQSEGEPGPEGRRPTRA
jgi:hypothetical protein